MTTNLFYDILALTPTQLRGLSGYTRNEDVDAYVYEWLEFELSCDDMGDPSATWQESYERFEEARIEA